MFDIGFTELMVIAVVGLIVIGPERLPRVARTVGHLLGRLQRYVGDVKSDIQREMHVEDLKKLQKEMTDSARDLESNFRDQANAFQSTMDQTAQSLNAAASGADAPGEAKATEPAASEDNLKDAERQIAQTVADDLAGVSTPPEKDDNQLALGLEQGEAKPDPAKEPKA